MNNRDARPSVLALVSVVLGVMSGIGLFVPECAVVALPGLVIGIIAVSRKNGRGIARFGVATSLAFLVCSAAWQVVQFRLEAPPEYERLSFASLSARESEAFVPYLGKRVCLKGYAWPTRSMTVTWFALSANGSADGNVKRPEYGTVIVELRPGETWNWHDEGIAVAGTLIQNPEFGVDPNFPKFKLVQSSVRRSSSRLGLAYRVRRDGC